MPVVYKSIVTIPLVDYSTDLTGYNILFSHFDCILYYPIDQLYDHFKLDNIYIYILVIIYSWLV